jgi:restriction system protein
MENVTQKFENTKEGLARKDAYSEQMAAQGYQIVSEQLEKGHIKGGEQCCLIAICFPLVFLAGRTPGNIIVTYARDMRTCSACGSKVLAGTQCRNCEQSANDKAQQAATKNTEAKRNLQKLQLLLLNGVAIDYRLNWQSLQKEFQVGAPQAPPPPMFDTTPLLIRCISALPVLERIAPLRNYRARFTEQEERFFQEQATEHERYKQTVKQWEQAKDLFVKEQANDVETKERQYLSKDPSALTAYWKTILEIPVYLEKPPCVQSLNYVDTSRRLIVEYALPPVTLLPTVEEAKYVAALDTLTETQLSPAQLTKLYGELLVKTTLVVLYKLFQSDVADALDSVAINGTVNIIDRATGHNVRPCVIAVEAEKPVFMSINFSQVDPQACFAGLKGEMSPNLSELQTVREIL